MPYIDLIENMKKEIAVYQKLGGDIYAPRRELPYYERLRSAARAYQREHGEKISIEQVYTDCGIKFDRDYNNFAHFVSGLSKVADQDGFVDSIKTKNASSQEVELKSYLNFHANELGISPGEYLILMTNFRYKSLTISGDYVAYLQEKFIKAYPDGQVRNLKAENPNLYWGLKHFQQYAPEKIGYNDALAFFGMTNVSSHKPPEPQQTTSNDEDILSQLSSLYPDRNIVDIYKSNPKLYFKIVESAVDQNQTVSQWFYSHGMNYAQGNNVSRLSKFQVDANEHETKLLAMREEKLQQYDLSQADEIDMFRINLEIAKQIGKELYGEQAPESAEISEQLSQVEDTQSSSEEIITPDNFAFKFTPIIEQ